MNNRELMRLTEGGAVMKNWKVKEKEKNEPKREYLSNPFTL
jgi:hypothetical protein